MFSKLLKKILPAEDKIFYTFFDESISIAHESSLFLQNILNKKQDEDYIQKAKYLRTRSKDVTEKCLQKLSTTFVTPIDSEDIQNISILISKITKKNVRIVKRIIIYNFDANDQNIKEQVNFLVKATEELKSAIGQLNKKDNVVLFTESNLRIKELESKEDAVLFDAWTELFLQNRDALTVLKVNDLYKNIESALETCFNLSDLLLNVVLKYS